MPSRPTRVTLITGDEPLTVASVIDHECSHPDNIHLVGVVASTTSLDNNIPGLLRDIPGMEGTSPSSTPSADHVPDISVQGSRHDFQYLHAVCDPGALKTVKGYRGEFSRRVSQAVLQTDPDVVVLANMMYVLTKQYGHVFVQRRGKKLGEITLNIHPSVLPEWRGAHAELKALKAGDTDGLGWTMHSIHDLTQQAMVALDTGTVVCQQRTPPVTRYDVGVSGELGSLYDAAIEEKQRVMTVHAAQIWAAKVATVFATAAAETTKVVVDEQAFAAEGRENFFRSSRYGELLRADHESWLKKNDKTAAEVSFEHWQSHHRQQYQRLLFREDGDWRTAETILGVSPRADPIDLNILTRYEFVLRGGREEVMQTFRGLLALAGKMGARVLSPSHEYFPSDGVLIACVATTADLLPYLAAVSSKIEIESSPWRIGAPEQMGEGLTLSEYRRRLEEAERDLGRS